MPTKLIVGLGNPGSEYEQTRHNVGAWYVEALARSLGVRLEVVARFSARVARTVLSGSELRLLVPATYMNESGSAVGPLARFYRIAPEEMLVAHDEVAFPPGALRVKQGGGMNGHNGLLDIERATGSRAFHRLRIGVGHPGDKAAMVGHLTRWKVPAAERDAIEQAIARAVDVLPDIVAGRWLAVMNALHAG
jgi:PTH1 family peptidyl-tRNA hydrolase